MIHVFYRRTRNSLITKSQGFPDIQEAARYKCKIEQRGYYFHYFWVAA